MSSGAVYLVTGATGFIGKHLALRLLSEGKPVRLLCRSGSEDKLPPALRARAEIAIGDLRDRESLHQATRGARLIFHCAGHVSDWGTEEVFRETNVNGTLGLLEGAYAARATRFVHLSSIAAFGTPSPEYFDDESPYGDGSRDAYSRTKAEGERLVFEFHRRCGLPVTVARPAVVYGPDGTWFEEPIRMIELGKMFLLGGGRGTCHPCYIDNLVDALVLLASHSNAVGQGYIVADDDPISFREYFNALAWVAGKEPIRKSIPLPVAKAMASAFELATMATRSTKRPLLSHTAIAMVTTQSRMSMRKIRDELGFKPRFGFQDAIRILRDRYRLSQDQPSLART